MNSARLASIKLFCGVVGCRLKDSQCSTHLWEERTPNCQPHFSFEHLKQRQVSIPFQNWIIVNFVYLLILWSYAEEYGKLFKYYVIKSILEQFSENFRLLSYVYVWNLLCYPKRANKYFFLKIFTVHFLCTVTLAFKIKNLLLIHL